MPYTCTENPAITDEEEAHDRLADFEDAMKVAAARACGARHIVTRNVKDYQRSPIPAIRPQDALREIS